MTFYKTMRKECVTRESADVFLVEGSGWYWVRFRRSPSGPLQTLEAAPGMLARPSGRLFITEAKMTIERHYPDGA